MSSLSSNLAGDGPKSFRLTTLGSVDLVDESGRRITSVLSQPRRLALLIYLSLAGRKSPVSRDKAVSMFWSDVDLQRASKSLSQAVYFLKQSLGQAAFEEVGTDYLGVSRDVVQCDASRLLNWAEEGSPDKAVGAYEGRFLSGFFISDAPDFEKWADEQTDYLLRSAGTAALEVAVVGMRRGDKTRALLTLDKIARLAPGDESIVAGQMELLESVGLYRDATEVYGRCAEYLLRECDSSPSDHLRRIAERIAAAEDAARLPQATERLPSTRQDSMPANGRFSRRQLITAVVTLGAAVSIGSLYGLRKQPNTYGTDVLPEIVIPAFVAPPEAQAEAQSMRNDVAGYLSDGGGIFVRLDQADARRTSAHPGLRRFQLKAATQPVDSEMQLSLLLSDMISGSALAHTSVTYRRADEVGHERAALRAAEFVRVQLGRAVTNLDARAFALPRSAIMQAKADRLTGDSLLRAGLFEAALARFAAADSTLLGFVPQPAAREENLLEHAEIALDFAWASLFASRDSSMHEHWLSRAYSYADSVVQLKPSPRAFELRGVAGYLLWQAAPRGSFYALEKQRSIVETDLKNAVRAQPASARSWSTLSSLLMAQGRFAEARIAAERAYSADVYLSESLEILQQLFFTSLEVDDNDAANRWCGEIARRFPTGWLKGYCELELIAWSVPSRNSLRNAALLVSAYERRGDAGPVPLARMKMTLAVVAAKAGRSDQARALQDSTLSQRAAVDTDELLPIRAWMWAEIGFADSASTTLERYIAKAPSRRAGVLRSRRFQSLTPAQPSTLKVANDKSKHH